MLIPFFAVTKNLKIQDLYNDQYLFQIDSALLLPKVIQFVIGLVHLIEILAI